MFVSRRDFFVIAAMLGCCIGLPLGAPAFGDGTDAQFSTDAEKVAIRGYDTVGYFTQGKPVPGSPKFETTWMGARWRFANAEHRDLFTKQPEAYAPRFGGFCVIGMTFGATVPPDPEAWVIVDGKLYLGAGIEDVAELQRDPERTVQTAEKQWKRLGH